MLQPVKDIPAFCNVMKYLGASDKTIASAEYQLIKINLIDWQNKENTEAFWGEVKLYKDAAGNNPFEELLNLAISSLVIPHSNADIERVFSSMNIVKSKLRNSMKLELLHAIPTVRFALLTKGKCCHSYQLAPNVLRSIDTLKAYSTPIGEASTSTSDQPDPSIVSLVLKMMKHFSKIKMIKHKHFYASFYSVV